MMNVTVKYFAIAKDIVGSPESIISLPEHSTIIFLLDEIIRKHPKLSEWKMYLRIAVNYEYVPSSYVLQPGDEVAVIPPVSGG